MADASLIALSEEIIITETIQVQGVIVEVLSADSSFVPMPQLRALAAARQVLVQVIEPRPVNTLMVEVLSEDSSFVFPDDIRALAAARQTLVIMPFNRPVNSYNVEVLAETVLDPLPAARVFALNEEIIVQEKPTPPVQNFITEVLAKGALESEANTLYVEILAADSTPNSVQRFSTEILADSTDDVALTAQQIVWFFNIR